MQYFAHGVEKILAVLTSIDPALRTPIAIGLGAVPGALSRYYLTLALGQWLGPAFPYGTVVVNLSGALIMGFFATLALDRVAVSPDLHLLIAVGFLGSYTTFSTYTLDTASLLQSSDRLLALLYWAGSAGLGLVSVEVGSFLARRLL